MRVAARTKDIWGERTPFANGEAWPERVDSFLDGATESEVERWVQSACLLCSNGCGVDIAVKDGRIVGVRGRAEDRINHGRLGPKGLYGWRANNAADRLTMPLVRHNGELREASWEDAMAAVVERSQQLLRESGPLSHGFYTSGQLFSEEYYALAMLARAGSAHHISTAIRASARRRRSGP
jgi:ferredoxin-nitrate reductase